MGITFRKLRADEILVRPNDRKNGKMSLLLYKDARVDMSILDETVGNEDWSCQYSEQKGIVFCGVGIYSQKHNAFIYKWDAGSESTFEAEKGLASDAFKRACVKWGIGRELYTAPRITVDDSNDRFYVESIGYDAQGCIDNLVICSSDGTEVYRLENGKKVSIPTASRLDILKKVCTDLNEETDDRDNLVKFYRYYEKRCEGFDKWNVGIVKGLWNKWNGRR